MEIFSKVGSHLEILYVWIRTALGDVNGLPICGVKSQGTDLSNATRHGNKDRRTVN